MSTYVPDAMVIVYSVVNGESLREAEEILQYLWRSNSMTEKAVIVVGNKTDLVRTRVVNIVGMFFGRLNGVRVHTNHCVHIDSRFV